MRFLSTFVRIFTTIVLGWLLPGALLAQAALSTIEALVAAGTVAPDSFLTKVGPLFAIVLGAGPMLVILGAPRYEDMLERVLFTLARLLVPNLRARVQQGQQAIDTHARDLLEQSHAEGRWDLSGWNRSLHYTIDWGNVQLQWHPSQPLINLTSLSENTHTHQSHLKSIIRKLWCLRSSSSMATYGGVGVDQHALGHPQTALLCP